jgi:ubiquinone/menaquinone biosynthesis C-methylase UbiE
MTGIRGKDVVSRLRVLKIVVMAGDDYRQASFEIWQRMAQGWDRDRRWFWDATRAAGEWMVDAVDPQPGQTILEIGAGTGETGFGVAAAVGEGGRLVSTDFSPNMVEAARAESERLGLRNVEHRVLDAERMDLDDDSVDGVLCRWAYMLMANPPAALRETRRVLREGGRLALSVWGAPAENPWGGLAARELLQQTGAPSPDPTAPGIFAMADPERTRSLLADAGFEVQRMEDIPIVFRFEDFEGYWAFLNDMAGAIALAIDALSDEDRGAYRERLEAAAEPHRSNGGYALPGVAQNTLAA